nr:BolA family protein [Pararhodospirillum photometricum]
MSSTPVSDRIRALLTSSLDPLHLEVYNDSRHHAGHYHPPKESPGHAQDETHLRVEIVALAFEGMSRLERHRKVIGLLKDLEGVHALSLGLRSPAENASA